MARREAPSRSPPYDRLQPPDVAAGHADTLSLTDHGNAERQRAARARLHRQRYHQRVCAELNRRSGDLARYYGPRPLVEVSVIELLLHGRWAA